MAAGTGLPPRLIEYWVHGEGAAKIRWDAPEGGDFDRCRIEIQKAITDGGGKPLPDREISGLCSTLHLMATSARPGHGPAEQASKGH